MRRLLLLLALAGGVLGCASQDATRWTGMVLRIQGGAEPVVGVSCAVNVEILEHDGSSRGVLTLPVAAGTGLESVAQGLAAAVTQHFGVDTVVGQAQGRSIELILADGFRFGTVSRAPAPRPETDPRGGVLQVEQLER